MPTEKEYPEWQKRRTRAKNRQRRSNNFFLSILLVIVITSVFVIVKNKPQLINNFDNEQLNKLLNFANFDNSSIKKITEKLVVEVDGPVRAGNGDRLKNNQLLTIDKQAASLPYYGNSVTELANILSQYATTDLEKARLIYSWITHNIAYDPPALLELLSGNYPDISTQTVLMKRKTICSGYANLYQKLAQAMGLNSVIILGYAKGFDYIVGDDNKVNHAWNGVEIDGEWYLIDATWGAGTVSNSTFNRQFNDYYFASSPDEFIYSHFPEKSKWQLLARPYTRQEFDAFPEVSDALFDNQVELVSHKNKTIYADGRLDITLKAPQNVVAIANLKSGDNSLEENYTFVQHQQGYIKVSAAFPSKGNYKLDIFAKQKYNSNSYPHVVTYQIVAKEQSEKFPITYSHFTKNSGYLETPLTESLPPNQLTYFKLRVDNATEVKVVDKSTNNWTDLIKYGNLFAGSIRVGSGKVMIFAKFPEDSRYWALLEYN